MARISPTLFSSSDLAIVHDWIDSYGGSERVLEAIIDGFDPESVYTLFANPRSPLTQKLQDKLKTSWLQKIPFAFRFHRELLPFLPRAIEQLDLSRFKVLLSSSHCVAKGILTRSDQLHISYVHTPARYLWDLYHPFLKDPQTPWLKRLLAAWIFKGLREWDFMTHPRVDLFLANSKNTARRLWRCYRRPSIVVYPFVDLTRFRFNPGVQKENYFVCVSRLVYQKRIDIAVQACSQLGCKLKIIGDGPEFARLKSIANPNCVEFLGPLSDGEMIKVVERAQALIFTSEEDFGMVPLEAQALGVPVIAFGKGGALESVKNGVSGIFFLEQTSESLRLCLHSLDLNQFKAPLIRAEVERFSKERFDQEMNIIVEAAWRNFSNSRLGFDDDNFISEYYRKFLLTSVAPARSDVFSEVSGHA